LKGKAVDFMGLLLNRLSLKKGPFGIQGKGDSGSIIKNKNITTQALGQRRSLEACNVSQSKKKPVCWKNES
jgi:hypothetical protein